MAIKIICLKKVMLYPSIALLQVTIGKNTLAPHNDKGHEGRKRQNSIQTAELFLYNRKKVRRIQEDH